MLYTTGHFCKWLFFSDWLIDWIKNSNVKWLVVDLISLALREQTCRMRCELFKRFGIIGAFGICAVVKYVSRLFPRGCTARHEWRNALSAGSCSEVETQPRWRLHSGHGSQGLPVERQRLKRLRKEQGRGLTYLLLIIAIVKDKLLTFQKHICYKRKQTFIGLKAN